jgi:hypothetical protein
MVLPRAELQSAASESEQLAEGLAAGYLARGQSFAAMICTSFP